MALTKVTGHVVKPDTNIQFHNTKSTGIVTFTHTSNATSSTTGALQITGGVGIVKDLHVGGNITVGGTLTYDDVTNIDSLGIITARTDIHLGQSLIHLGDPDTKMTFDTNIIKFDTAGSERFRITSNGRVAIGTDNPTSTLHVRGHAVLTRQTGGTITNGLFLDAGDTGQGNRPDIILKGSGSAGLNQLAMQVYYNNGSDKAFHLRYDGGAYLGGSVGIGTESAATKLHVDGGNITIRNGTAAGVILDEETGVGGSLKVTTAGGTASFGPGNTSYCHIMTDRGAFYFGKQIVVDQGRIGSYDEDLELHAPINTIRVTIDKDTGRVGINTTNPNALLDVYQDGTGTVIDTIITRTSGGGAFAVQCSNVAAANPVWALRTYSAEDLVLSPGGHADANEKVRIKADTGNVGIGTDNPDWILHVLDDSNTLLSLESVNTNADLVQSDTVGSTRIRSTSGGFEFFTAGDASSTNATSSTKKLTIASDGQVSISGAGTTFGNNTLLNIAPANRTTAFSASDGDTWHDLVLKQSASATTNSVGIAFEVSPSVYHKNAGTGIVAIKDGNNFDYGTHLAFITRPHTAVAEERLRIQSDGKVGIGELTPDSKLDILHSSSTNSATENLIHLRTDPGAGYVSRGLFIKIGRDGNYDNSAARYDIVGSSGNSGFHAFEVQGDEKLRITKEGFVGIGSQSPGGVLDLYHATSNTILNVKSGDAGSVINLIDNATRSSIEQNGSSLKIVSDTAGTHANSDIRLQVDGATHVLIDNDGNVTNTGIATSYVTTQFGSNFAKIDLRGTNIANSNHYILSYGAGHPNNQEFHMVNTLGDLVFRTGSSSPNERLRITSGGDVLINDVTNSLYNDSSGGGMNLKAAGQLVLAKQASSAADSLIWLNDTGQTTNRFIVMAQDGSEKGHIGLVGNSLSLGVSGGHLVQIAPAYGASYPTSRGSVRLGGGNATNGFPLIGYNNSGTRIATHVCTGSFYASTGMIIIKTTLPKHNTGYTMWSCRITGYAYSTNEGGAIDCVVGCYTGENNYYNPTVTGTYPNAWRDHISFATITTGDHNGHLCIRLGQTSTSQLCEIAVTDFVWGYSSVSDVMAEGWSIVCLTSDSGYNSQVVSAIQRSKEFYNDEFAVVGANSGELLTNRRNRGGTIQGTYQYTELNDGSNVKHYIRSPLGHTNITNDYANTNYAMRVTVGVVGTGTVSTATTWLFQDNSSDNGQLTGTNLYGNTSNTSNNVVMGVDGGKAYWAMAHSVNYRVTVKVEFISGGKDGATYTDEFGDY